MPDALIRQIMTIRHNSANTEQAARDVVDAIRAALCASGQQVRAVSVERVEMVNYESGYEQPAEPIWRVVVGGYCADFETESAARNFAGAIAALTPAPDHRSFPDAADGRPLPPMADELMTAGLSGEDARFVAIQLAQNGLMLVPAPQDWGTGGAPRFVEKRKAPEAAHAVDVHETPFREQQTGLSLSEAPQAPEAAQAEEIRALREALEGMVDLYDTDEGTRSLPQVVAARAALAGKGEA